MEEDALARQEWRLLLAFDGRPSALRALERVAALHHDGDSVAVIEIHEPGDASKSHLDQARDLLAERGIDARLIATTGSTAREICLSAERDGYDTIVIGRRNPPHAGHALPGPVAARVTAGARCDVIIVA